VQYGHAGPLLDFWTAAFFVLGVAYATLTFGIRAAFCSPCKPTHATISSSTRRRRSRTHRIYFFGGRSTFIRYDAERFLVPDTDTIDVRGARLSLPVPARTDGGGIAFVIDVAAPDAETRLGAICRAYPDGREETVRNRGGAIAFRSYLVSPHVLGGGR
jgi:hypothetical protein